MEKAVGDVYEFEEIIGEGAFSNVVLATHNETKHQVAIKLVDKAKIENEVQRERIEREISIMEKCNHPNVIKLVETYESDLEISLVMELMRGGDLFERITAKGIFTEEEARATMYNIFSAVDYLHDRGIVHRDLKPENLLYSSKEASSVIKIGDFGLAKYTTETEELATPCGTIAYTAPEVTRHKVYSRTVDIWSCGCILYFMLFGRPPFYSADEEEIYDLVSEGEFSYPAKSLVSDSARELIGHLLEKNPSKRYTAKEVLLHPWMTGRTTRPRDIHTTSPSPLHIHPHIPSTSTTSTSSITRKHPTMPLSIISNIRVSLNSAIEAQRGPLTPPLSSPLESTLWKKRMAKARTNALAISSPKMMELDLSEPELELELELELEFSDSDTNNDEKMDDGVVSDDDVSDEEDDMIKIGAVRKQYSSDRRMRHKQGSSSGVGGDGDSRMIFVSEEDSDAEVE